MLRSVTDFWMELRVESSKHFNSVKIFMTYFLISYACQLNCSCVIKPVHHVPHSWHAALWKTLAPVPFYGEFHSWTWLQQSTSCVPANLSVKLKKSMMSWVFIPVVEFSWQGLGGLGADHWKILNIITVSANKYIKKVYFHTHLIPISTKSINRSISSITTTERTDL